MSRLKVVLVVAGSAAFALAVVFAPLAILRVHRAYEKAQAEAEVTAKAEARTKPVPVHDLTPGRVVRLMSPKGGTVAMVVTDRFAYHDFALRVQADDQIGLRELTDSKRLLFTEDDTAKVIEYHADDSVTVRMLTGEHKGRELVAPAVYCYPE